MPAIIVDNCGGPSPRGASPAVDGKSGFDSNGFGVMQVKMGEELYPNGYWTPAMSPLGSDYNVVMASPFNGNTGNNSVIIEATGHYYIVYAGIDNAGTTPPSRLLMYRNGDITDVVFAITPDSYRMSNYSAVTYLQKGDVLTLVETAGGHPEADARLALVMCGGVDSVVETASFTGTTTYPAAYGDYLGPWTISPGATHIAAHSVYHGVNILIPGWYELTYNFAWNVSAIMYSDAMSTYVEWGVAKTDLHGMSNDVVALIQVPGATGSVSFKALMKAVDPADILADPDGVGSHSQFAIRMWAAYMSGGIVAGGTFTVSVELRKLLVGR